MLNDREPSEATPTRRRILSGMRPTGKLHLGNYMGALHNWVRLQEQYECFFFIADWHALTTDYADPSRIKQNTVDVALDFLAAGLDPAKCTIFVQSHVKQHAELHLLLSMMTPLSWLERVPSYKDQQQNLRSKDLAMYGFLGYPLLQSADILLYKPEFVPVGQDQVSHIELTREVARRFNSLYKTEIFPEPDALLTPTPKLPGTDGRKMSKSYANTIALTEPSFHVFQKLQNMTTNGQRILQSDPGNPDLCPVGDLHKVFSDAAKIDYTHNGCRKASIPCAWCKLEAAKSIIDLTQPIIEKRRELEQNIDQTWAMLLEQADSSAAVAEQTLISVRAALNVTRDLGAAWRSFGWTEADREKRRDLSTYTDVLSSDQNETQRDSILREYWHRNICPYDIPLSQEVNRSFHTRKRELEEPLITRRKKRVLVASPANPTPFRDFWMFNIANKTYEVWVLLTWNEKNWLDDFIIPQGMYSQAVSAWKRRQKIEKEKYPENAGFQVGITAVDGRFYLQVGADPLKIDITDQRANYRSLQ